MAWFLLLLVIAFMLFGRTLGTVIGACLLVVWTIALLLFRFLFTIIGIIIVILFLNGLA